jgi:hypothetical protein
VKLASVLVPAVVSMVVAACSRPEPAAQSAPSALHSPARWRVECRPVHDAELQACYGPGWDENQPHDPERFQFYQLSIERKQPSDVSQVLFVKRLALAEVDPQLLRDSAPASLASYDAATRSVRFAVGAAPIVVPLEEIR